MLGSRSKIPNQPGRQSTDIREYAVLWAAVLGKASELCALSSNSSNLCSVSQDVTPLQIQKLQYLS